MALFDQPKIDLHDREPSALGNQAEDLRRDDVDAREADLHGASDLCASFGSPPGPRVRQSAEAVFVDEQGPGGLAAVDGEGRERSSFRVRAAHGGQIGVRDDVDVVQKKRLAPLEERRGLQQPSSGLERRSLLPGNPYLNAEASSSRNVVLDLVGVVVDVDDQPIGTDIDQPASHPLEHGYAGNLHERLRSVLRERSQPFANARGEDHRLHHE
jgi:hypothetical protein